MKKPLGFQHIYFILLIFSYHLCKNLSGTIQELQQQWLISAFNSVAGETNYVERNQLRAKRQVLSTNPHLPQALGQNLPLITGEDRSQKEVCLGEANKQSTGTRALVPAPFNGILWLERIFGWVGWMAFVTRKGKLRVFSMQMTWFYCHQPGMASLLSEEMAQDELLQPPVVIFGRCSPTWSWLLFNNVWLALILLVMQGSAFLLSHLGDSPGGDTCWIVGVCGCSVRIFLRPS